ncbi:hypothetical protein CKY39_16115 [Variovorax boronicumulans]|uniref:Uncharacterized protein n=1 Tax=Variovorax boronicumulans TaxID=436515 RepID=A0A250DKU3_9BURK|nr:hypothetical protein [Variovorax boronicumulans]ATA54563.1 hypothetical protein CKY39_16115 [Variovorax boronicumulans]
MTTAAVQTSALDAEPDMFGSVDLASGPDMHAEMLAIPGVLIANAEVRTKLVGLDQHPLPVLVLELRPLSGLQRVVHAELVYTEPARKSAERLAATLKKGTRVTVTTPLDDMRTYFPHVAAVALIPTPKATS